MKNNLTKKALSVLLALTMLIGLFSVISVNSSAEAVKTNIASNAAATADGQDSEAHNPSKAVDGVINREAQQNSDQSRWSVEDNKGEGPTGSHWLKIDLGSSKTFNEIVIDWERKNVTDYSIEVSDNDKDYREIYKNSDGNSFTDTIIPNEAVTARYVRVSVNSYTKQGPLLNADGTEKPGDWASVSIYEIKLLQYTTSDNLATGKTATSDSNETADFSADKAVDGNDSTRWASAKADAPHWVQIDMGEPTEVAAATIHWERNTVKSFEIQYSDTAAENSWNSAYSYSSSELYNGWNTKVNFEKPVTAKYFRIYIKDFSDTGRTESDPEDAAITWNTISIIEIGLYGSQIEIPQFTLDEVVNSIKAPKITTEDRTLPMPDIPEGFKISIAGTNYDNVIEEDGTIHFPLTDKEVKVAFKVSLGDETKTTRDITVLVPGTKEIPENANAKPVVIPELQEWVGASEGNFAFKDTSKIVISEESLTDTAEKFALDLAEIANCEKPQIIIGTKTDASNGNFYFELDTEDPLGLLDEGYYINVDDTMYITAKTATGAYWATRSILQVFKQCAADGTAITMAKGEIRDYPKYKVRGFMLDIGRLPIELGTIYDIAETMSWYKLNDLELHINDNGFLKEHYDEGINPFDVYSAFRLESNIKNDDGESLTSDDLYYTKEEFKNLILDGRKIGINIVPEFDFPAHSLAVTKIFPELAYIGSDNDMMLVDHIDISKPESVDLVKRIWDEYTEGENALFDDLTTVNIGGDEYRVNPEVYRQFVDTMLQYVQSKGNTVRVWGSLTELSGNTEVYSDNVQMYIWNTTWANPKQMIEEGYDIININDFEVYMVPGANYYQDYLNPKNIYNNWKPNVINGITIQETESQLLGGSYALWNDRIGVLDNGIYEYDVFDRFYSCAASFSEKLWGEGNEKTYEELSNAYEKTSIAPGTNPFNDIETSVEGNTYVEYSFTDGSDISGNGYNIVEKDTVNASYTEISDNNSALQLNGGESYIATPVKYLPVGTDLTLRVKRTSGSAGEQILFESDYQPGNGAGKYAIQAVQNDTGKVGFVRGTRTYTFDYELPVGEWVTLTFRGEKDFASLYVNGKLVDKLGSTAALDMRATLTSPFSRIGSKTNSFVGLIDFVKAENIYVDDNTIISNNMFTVECDNENTHVGSEGPISLAFDNDTSTFWHSNYTPVQALPANIDIHAKDGETLDIGALTYVPRQTGTNGNITEAVVYYKNTLSGVGQWTEITSVKWESNSNTKKLDFGKVYNVTDLRIKVTNGNNGFGSAAEFYLHNQAEKIITLELENAVFNAQQLIEQYPSLTEYSKYGEVYQSACELLENGGSQQDYDLAAEALTALNAIVIRGGDINNNGKLTVSDATLIQLSLVNRITDETVKADIEKYGDIDFSGQVNISDATEIQKIITGHFGIFGNPTV